MWGWDKIVNEDHVANAANINDPNSIALAIKRGNAFKQGGSVGNQGSDISKQVVADKVKKFIAKKTSTHSKTGWSQAETDKLNAALNLKLTTEDRVALGNQLFKGGYRGTREQNSILTDSLMRQFAAPGDALTDKDTFTSAKFRQIPSSSVSDIMDTSMIEDLMFGSDNSTQPSPTRGRGRFWFSGNKQPI